MRILLLAPESGTGAASYNHRLIAALAALGHDAGFVRLRGVYPAAVPDDADLAMVAGLPAGARLILDGMAFGLFPALPPVAAGLIHHTSAMIGEQDARAAEALRAAERAVLAALPRVIATSAAVAARLGAEYGVGPERLHLVTPGVAVLPRRLPHRGAACHVLSLGPLVPRRAHEVLLRALARVTELEWRLTLIGSARRDPAHAALLRGIILAEGIGERVVLADDAADIPWDSADIVAFAHPAPVLTGVVMEALRRGIPLAFGVDGFAPCPAAAAAFCPPGDVDTLSKALRRMMFDPDLRAAMADAAWQAGTKLPDWETQARLVVGQI